jgi:DNA-binding NtrC family response regulator
LIPSPEGVVNKKNFKILVVDDEEHFLLLVSNVLDEEGYVVKTASSGNNAFQVLEQYTPDLILTDLRMPDKDGLHLMETVKAGHPDIDFIFITAFATVESAVDAMKKGAIDYITKPLKNLAELRIIVSRVYEKRRLLQENIALKEEQIESLPPLDLIFSGIDRVYEEVRAVATADTTVILYGETGTGKTLVAKVIHILSGRKGLFVTVNCAAIPDTLLESEFFGYEKGAFTGATSTKKGKFELTHEGTIFLDEISEMTTSLQAKLLKVLQEKTFERLGGIESITTDARVITATNRDLTQLVREGRFREDLFYRLNVFPIQIPPLRERREIIPKIADYMMNKIARKLGRHSTGIAEDSMKQLISYPWPGNIRELENTIERAIILSKKDILHIPLPEMDIKTDRFEDLTIRNMEKKTIEAALKKVSGNRRRAAEMLGISLRALQYKIKEYNISEGITM